MKVEYKIFNKTFDYKLQEFKNGFIVVNGYCIYKNKVIKNHDFINLLKNKNEIELVNIFKNIEGLYRIIIKKDDFIFMVSDSIRSMPLFFSFDDNKLIISDNAYYIQKNMNLHSFDKAKIKEFLYLALTTSNKTILNNLYQVDTGQIVKLDMKSKKIEYKYYHYYISNILIGENIYKKAYEIIEKTFISLIDTLDKRMVVVPLSGGYDSRLVVVMLKKLGYKNVVCFSYGNKNSFEVSISKKVAYQLGYKWYFVEYSDQLIKDNIYTDEFKNYMFYSGSFSSVPHFQDFLAVKYLKDNNLIDEDSIFVPGHSGDLLGGSHLRNFNNYIKENNFSFESSSNIFDMIFDFWYQYYNPYYSFSNDERKYLTNEIEFYFKDLNCSKVNSWQYLTDAWDIANRQGKFIVNSCRVYDYFNYEFRLPLWDREFAHFWQSLPVELKIKNIVYNEVLEQLFDEFKVNYKKEKEQKSIKYFIKKILPRDVINILKKAKNITKRSDINNFDIYIKYILKDIELKLPIDKNHIDMVSGSWYLDLIMSEYNKDL